MIKGSIQSKKRSLEKAKAENRHVGETKQKAEALRKEQEQEKVLQALEMQEAQAIDAKAIEELSPSTEVSPEVKAAVIARQQSTTRPEVVKILSALGINLNIQLTKTDTANLLATLLTCNDEQLKAMYTNEKVPIAIKIVIKRLREDAKLGNLEALERLWDRVFGKNDMTLNLPTQTQLATGIIPNTAVSREAYLIIRDTLIK